MCKYKNELKFYPTRRVRLDVFETQRLVPIFIFFILSTEIGYKNYSFIPICHLLMINLKIFSKVYFEAGENAFLTRQQQKLFNKSQPQFQRIRLLVLAKISRTDLLIFCYFLSFLSATTRLSQKSVSSYLGLIFYCINNSYNPKQSAPKYPQISLNQHPHLSTNS